MTVRNAFLKMPEQRDYEAQEWPDSRFNQFGFWRLGRPTYDQSGAVDPSDPHWGMTDFWTQPISRFNIWQDTRDAAGNLVREEADSDHDFRPDSVALYSGSTAPFREEFDTNWDGLVDLWVELQRDCAFARSGASECTTECAIDWCGPRTPPVSLDPDSAPPEPPPPPSSIAILYRDGTGDGIWDTSEVLYGEHPICVAFNTNTPGDTPQTVHPEVVEVYKPAMAQAGRPEIDYLRRDYLDLNGNPIVRCENSDGAIVDCPSPCAR